MTAKVQKLDFVENHEKSIDWGVMVSDLECPHSFDRVFIAEYVLMNTRKMFIRTPEHGLMSLVLIILVYGSPSSFRRFLIVLRRLRPFAKYSTV